MAPESPVTADDPRLGPADPGLEVGRIRGILFDLDGTFYDEATYPAYFRSMDLATGARVRELYGAANDEEAYSVLEADRIRGGFGSKSETLEHRFGISLAEMNRWREARTFPENHLRADARLCEVLRELSERFTLGLGTNNAPGLLTRILACLGVDRSLFAFAISSEEVGAAKPNPDFFIEVERRMPHPSHALLSVGDSEKSDCRPARARGYQSILVGTMADVYCLPSLLR